MDHTSWGREELNMVSLFVILPSDNHKQQERGDSSIHFYNSHDKTIPMIQKWPGPDCGLQLSQPRQEYDFMTHSDS